MKILLVANYKPDRQRSMARYAEMLHSELRKRGYDVTLFYPVHFATRLVNDRSRLFRWLGYIDKFVLTPPLLRFRARNADIVHVCDHSNSAYLRWTGSAANLITAHDALAIRSALGHFRQNPTRWSGVRLQQWILQGLNHPQRIACVSEKTRQDFRALLPNGPAMTVIPNPLGANFKPASNDEISGIRFLCGLSAEDKYLLHVGKDNWYKNRPGVISIMSKLRKTPFFRNTKLVMAGTRLPDSLRRSAQELRGVIECVNPTDEQLCALYSGALALLFPSLEEGFGWPILEAQACGCPVITTARQPMEEVAGGAAILIDPENPDEAAEIIAARIHEIEMLRQRGFANVENYSKAKAIDRYCQVYDELAATSTKSEK